MTREEAKNILTCVLHTNGAFMDYLDREDVEAIKFLASDERPHGEWIPCSERLPDKEEKIYLVTIDYGDGLSCVAPRFFWNKERLWNEAEKYITAWMPLPEPYKKEGGAE